MTDWTYDKTAQDNTLRWKVKLKANGYDLGYDIALGAEGGKEVIAFENTYDKVEVPDLPETGEKSMPALYLALLAISIAGILVFRKRVAK